MDDTRTMNLMGMEVPAGTDPASIYRRIQMMEQLTERSMTIPGINYPIGLDAVIGLVPVIGDIFGIAMGTYIVWEARNLNMPTWHMARMVGNVAFDGVVTSYVGGSHRYSAELMNIPPCFADSANVPTARVTHVPAVLFDS